MSEPIVLGFDGSAQAKAALAEAARLAAAEKAPVVVVFAYYISPLGGGDVRDYKLELERVAAETTVAAVAELAAAGIEASARHVSGRPAEALLEVARELEARMIVVGGRHQGTLVAAVRGSLVTDLLQHATVPVLVVPA
jgi:nucleotide-binding universal stress UspA family protein